MWDDADYYTDEQLEDAKEFEKGLRQAAGEAQCAGEYSDLSLVQQFTQLHDRPAEQLRESYEGRYCTLPRCVYKEQAARGWNYYQCRNEQDVESGTGFQRQLIQSTNLRI
jgi:hypothetical protein